MSHLPPFPRGRPPRPDDRIRSFDPPTDSYRRYDERDDYRGRDDYYRPRSPPPPAPPAYEFRGDSRYSSRSTYEDDRYPPRYENNAPGRSSNGYGDSYRPREEPPSFTFRHEAPSNVDFRNADKYRRSPPRNGMRRDNGPSRFTGGSNNRGRNFRGRGPRLASEREFLQGNRAPTPELMPGINGDDAIVRYKPVDELSDSDEAEMDFSDDDISDSQPKKKQARTETKATDAEDAPKWSNPDPYTALPPPDESLRKKKDMVKLIRKARVTASSDVAKPEAVVDDFISFDMGVDENEEDDYEPPPATIPTPANTNSLSSRITIAIPKHEQKNSSQPGNNVVKINGQLTIENHASAGKVRIKFEGDEVVAKSAGPVQKPDLSLGSRKRNIRDEIKAPPKIHETTKGKKGPVNGSIVKQWQIIQGTSPTPWIEIDHSDTVNMGFWLHKEIMDFYHFVKPKAFEQTIREKLIEDLNARIQQQWPDAQILSFGSFPAGLYLPTADMDLVMVSKSFKEKGWAVYHGRMFLNKLRNFLVRSHLTSFEDVEVIPSARVPLVKYVDKLTGLKVDISFENHTGITANTTFQNWKVQYPAMPMIATIIKHLLAMRGLNEPVNGGIGGFSVICLVVSLLQHMPQVQSRSMIPEHHLGEVLMEFFNLYGNEFNTVTTGIQLNPPGYFSKSQANIPYRGEAEKFMIIDPNNSSNDIAGGSSNTKSILRCFSDCYRILQQTMATLKYSPDRSKESILGCILGGNYSSFKLQRDHLAHVHDKLLGPIE